LIQTFEEYTGSKGAYGVIGMQRDTIQQQRGFKVTHSVYSFFLLNVAAAAHAGVFYPAKAIWEDIEFLHLLDEANLAVCKVSKYVHGKAHTRGREPSPPPPPPKPLEPTVEDYLQSTSYCFQSAFLESENGLLDRPDTNYAWLDVPHIPVDPCVLRRVVLEQHSSNATVSTNSMLLPLQAPEIDEEEDCHPEDFHDFTEYVLKKIRRIRLHPFSLTEVLDVILLVRVIDDSMDDDDDKRELVRNVKNLTRQTIAALRGSFEKLHGSEIFLHEHAKFYAIRLPLTKKRPPQNPSDGDGIGAGGCGGSNNGGDSGSNGSGGPPRPPGPSPLGAGKKRPLSTGEGPSGVKKPKDDDDGYE